MSSSKFKKTGDNGAIRFDDFLFYNRDGIEQLGFSTLDADAIYGALIDKQRLSIHPQSYVFIDSVLNLKKHWFASFKKPNQADRNDAGKAPWIVNAIARLLLKKFQFESVKVTGFFKIGKPDQIWLYRLRRLEPVNSVYINSERFSQEQKPQLHVDAQQYTDNHGQSLVLPSDRSPDKIGSLIFFPSCEVYKMIKIHAPDFDLGSISDKEHIRYKNGVVMNSNKQGHKADKGESPSKIATRERIIAALIWVLQNPSRPYLKDNESVYRHLEKHFRGIKGLKGSYISEFIHGASEELRALEREQNFTESYEDRFK